jgi:glycosyltransferase involved in cell wall biosynthesis
VKILHVISNISARYGGPAKACRDMCRALAEAGHEVTIFTTNRDHPSGLLPVPAGRDVAEDGYRIVYFPVEFGPYLVSLGMARRLRRETGGFDVVHIHGLYRFPQAMAARCCRRASVPYIVRPHGSLDPFLYHRRRRRLVKRAYERAVEFPNLNRATAIHFTAEEEMALTAPLGLKAPGVVIPNGINPADFEDLPERGRFRARHGLGDAPVVLHLGRVNFKKGLDILVDAVARTGDDVKNLRLVIAGPDNEGYGRQVEGWIARHGLGDRVLVTGMLQGDDKRAALADADVFALPSYSENFGLAVVEAMACGIPVVISDRVNIWREVRKAGAGLVTPCDAAEVAKALTGLLTDPERRARMGESGRRLARERYDWRILVGELEALYRRVAEPGAPAPLSS